MKLNDIPEPFKSAALKVKQLERKTEYIGAFVFGSVARGEQNKNSDLDVKIITTRRRSCNNVNHPVINNIKLDLSFNSIKIFKEGTQKEIDDGRRIPMIAESIILFDKKGYLQKVKDKAVRSSAKKLKKHEYQWSKFMFFHAHDKTKRHLKSDHASALLSMGINVNAVLEDHYRLNKRWWVSNKRILSDLKQWDPKLEKLLRSFALSNNLKTKYKYFVNILDYIAKPMGEWKTIGDLNCNCKLCEKDLSFLKL